MNPDDTTGRIKRKVRIKVKTFIFYGLRIFQCVFILLGDYVNQLMTQLDLPQSLPSKQIVYQKTGRLIR